MAGGPAAEQGLAMKRLRLWRTWAAPILCVSCVAAAPGLGGDEGVSGVEALDSAAVERLDEIVQPYLDNHSYVTLGVVVDGEIVLTRSYRRDREEL
jgi:hypothetical protein